MVARDGPNGFIADISGAPHLFGGEADLAARRIVTWPAVFEQLTKNLAQKHFATVQMPEYTPHAFRKTLTKYGDEISTTMKHRKAWSLNLGHENMATTINSYLPVKIERQMELFRDMGMACRSDA